MAMSLINVDQRTRVKTYHYQAALVRKGVYAAISLAVFALVLSAVTYAATAPTLAQCISSLSLVDQWGEE